MAVPIYAHAMNHVALEVRLDRAGADGLKEEGEGNRSPPVSHCEV
jgi:hypothetical protein